MELSHTEKKRLEEEKKMAAEAEPEPDWFGDSIRVYEKRLNTIKENYDSAKELLDTMVEKLKEEKERNIAMIEKYRKFPAIQSDIIEMNVGGQFFSTLRTTVTKKVRKIKPIGPKDEFYESNIIEAILNGFVEPTKDKGDHLFIDRNPKYFGYILDYLRLANTKVRYVRIKKIVFKSIIFNN